MRRSIVGGVFAVVAMVAIVVCFVMMTRERFHDGLAEDRGGGSIAFGVDTEHMPVEAMEQSEQSDPVGEAPAEQPPVAEAAAPEPWQPEVTIRIRQNKRAIDTQLRRFEELRRRVELSYATIGGYRDAIDRFPMYSETGESRAVLAWGGQLASQTARLQVQIQDSIVDLRALTSHEEYQQSRLAYMSALSLDHVKSIDPTRIPRSMQHVYDWFTRYAGAIREVESEWRAALDPTYTALENMLEAEAERARERREDVLRQPPEKNSASFVGENGSK